MGIWLDLTVSTTNTFDFFVAGMKTPKIILWPTCEETKWSRTGLDFKAVDSLFHLGIQTQRTEIWPGVSNVAGYFIGPADGVIFYFHTKKTFLG